jgi:uncharacterized phage-associated protein
MMEYTVNKEEKNKEIKGREISYIGKEAFCKECDSNIFVQEIRDYNLEKLDEVYRDSEDIILLKEIVQIVEKYNVGKRPLSKLLGWGEGTLTRYLDGDIPTKNYSNTLKKVLDDAGYMNKLLSQNKDRVSSHAYKSCKNAIEEMTATNEPKTEDKIDSIVKYLLQKSSDITPLALQKLLYYTQSFYKVFYDEFLFKEDCEAWVHGPVYREIYQKYKKFGYDPIEDKNISFESIDLDKPEKEILDSIIYNFGCYSGKVLERMTHKEKPWLFTRKDLKKEENCSRIIKKELIDNYFSQIKAKYNMLSVSDIKDYSMEHFKKIYN